MGIARFQTHIESLREHMKAQLYWVPISALDLDQEEQKSVEVGGSVGELKFGFTSSVLRRSLGWPTARQSQVYSTAELGGWLMARFHFACCNFFRRIIQLWSDVTILSQRPPGCSSLRADG